MATSLFRRRKDITVEEVKIFFSEKRWSIRKISEYFHSDSDTIASRLSEAGIEGRRVKRPDIKTEEVVALYKSGLDMTSLARHFNCRRVTIRKRLIKAEVQIDYGRRLQGSGNPNWKGGRRETRGYIQVYKPDHPRAIRSYIWEHQLIWEEYHKRPLLDGWVIHHLNGIKSDNRPRNLFAMPRKKHLSQQLLLEAQKRLREMEIENKQLCRAFENSQSIFYISEN